MKSKFGKKLGRRGKIGLSVLIAAMFIGVASAGFLDYYGSIKTTATVSQSVLLDGNDYTNPVTEEGFTVTGGCCICKEHTLENQGCSVAPIDVTKDINAYGKGKEGVHVDIYKPFEYSYAVTTPEGLEVTVEDTGDGWLQWTYIYATEPTHTPKMTVAINYPNGFCITTFDDGDHNGWYYSPDPYDEGTTNRFADYSGGSYKGWVVTTASDNVLTVKILKCELDDMFDWHGYANYNGQQVWIEIDDDWLPTASATIREPIPTPFALQPGEIMNFIIKYCFDSAIIPGQYDITTKFIPYQIIS